MNHLQLNIRLMMKIIYSLVDVDARSNWHLDLNRRISLLEQLGEVEMRLHSTLLTRPVEIFHEKRNDSAIDLVRRMTNVVDVVVLIDDVEYVAEYHYD